MSLDSFVGSRLHSFGFSIREFLPRQEIATGFGALLIPNPKNYFRILMMGPEIFPETCAIFNHQQTQLIVREDITSAAVKGSVLCVFLKQFL
jgi:hypothetical protein